MHSKLPLVAAAAALALTACGAPQGDADADDPQIIASFYPLQWATEQVVAGTGASVEVLTQPGVDAHGVELSPQQIASLSSADLIVYLEGFQPEVDEAISVSGTLPTINVSDVIELAPLADEHHHDEHAEDEHAEDEHAEDHEGHDHGDVDPHFWLDTDRMSTVVLAIAEHLGGSSPEHAQTYLANAEATVEELTTIDGEYQEGLAECERREFITTHAAFHYLAERYDLEEIGISGVNPDAEPSPARIAEVHAEAQRHGITTIFFETLTSPAVAESIAGDLGLRTAVLDPLEGITESSPGEDYPSVMRANLEALRSANECS